jgi:hypothetical protein
VRLVRPAAFASILVVACGSFGEGAEPPGSATASDGGAPGETQDAAGVGPIPDEEEVVGNTSPGSTTGPCLMKMLASDALFCSDFDDVDPWSGWDRPDAAGGYDFDTSAPPSLPKAAKLTITAGTNADARLKHKLDAKKHFKFVAKVKLASPTDPPTDAVVLKLQFISGTLFVRSSGRVVETIKQATGSPKFVEQLSNVGVPFGDWLSFELEVDLPTGQFVLTVAGQARQGTMNTKRSEAESVLLVAGPADPRPDPPPQIIVGIDDVFVTGS